MVTEVSVARRRRYWLLWLAVVVAIGAALLAAQYRGQPAQDSARSGTRAAPAVRPAREPAASRSQRTQPTEGRNPFAKKVDAAGEFRADYLAAMGRGIAQTSAAEARAAAGFPLLLPDAQASPELGSPLLAVRYPDEDGRPSFAFYYRRGIEVSIRVLAFPVGDSLDRRLATEAIVDPLDPGAKPVKAWKEISVRGGRAVGHEPSVVRTRYSGEVDIPGVVVFEGPGAGAYKNVQYTVYGEKVALADLIAIVEALR